MHLLIDLQSCQSGSRLGGIGRYSLELAKAMARRSDGIRFSLLLSDRGSAGEFAVRREFRDLLPQSEIHVFPAPRNCRYIHDGGVLARDAEIIRNRFIADLKPDVVHLSSLIEGLTEDIVTSIDADSPWLSAVTVYDLIPLKQPDKYLSDPTVRSHYFDKVSQFRNADVLLGISDFSTREILDHIGKFDGIAKNILGGIDPIFRPNPEARQQYAQKFTGMGITRRFVMYTASFDNRKNQKGLIEAFAKLPWKLRKDYQLVLVGNGWPGVYNELKDFGGKLGLRDDSIVFPGHVSDEDLAALYSLAELFVFPSLWEGLGMPVLEAMASGTPCIGSNTTSVPEVLGMAEASFDPTNSAEISALMERSLTDTAFRQKLTRHAATHSATMNWDASAAKALDGIKEAKEKSGKKRGKKGYALTRPATSELADLELLSIAEAKRQLLADQAEAAEQMKIGWLTTWDKRCGIASYSRNILDNFPFDATVLRQNGQGGERFELARKISTIRSWDEGKNAALDEVAEAVEKLRLTDLVIQFNYGLFNFDELNRLIVTLFETGVNCHIVLHSTFDPLEEQGHRLAELAEGLRSCARVFVHSDRDVERLATLGVSENVRVIPLGIRRLEAVEGTRPKRKKAAPLTIGSYGFFLPHKGLIELIKATRILRDGGENVRLKLVNACYGDSGGVSQGLIDEARQLVETLSLGDAVEFHTDYASDEASAALLADCDLIAFPYQQTGESASAAIRMPLAIGKPILTTPLSIFDDLKELVFQADGCSPSDIADAIKRLGGDIRAGSGDVPAILNRMEKRVAAHDFRAIAIYLAREIATCSLCTRTVERFTAAKSRLLTRDATWAGDRWVSTNPGLMLFGPHIALEPGIYALVLDYRSLETTANDPPSVTITADNSATTLLEFNLDEQPRGATAIRHFHIDRPRNAVEVLIRSGNSAIVEVFGYNIVQYET